MPQYSTLCPCRSHHLALAEVAFDAYSVQEPPAAARISAAERAQAITSSTVQHVTALASYPREELRQHAAAILEVFQGFPCIMGVIEPFPVHQIVVSLALTAQQRLARATRNELYLSVQPCFDVQNTFHFVYSFRHDPIKPTVVEHRKFYPSRKEGPTSRPSVCGVTGQSQVSETVQRPKPCICGLEMGILLGNTAC